MANSIKAIDRQLAIALVLIILGGILVFPFIKPYIYLLLGPTPRTDRVIGKDRIFVPSVKLKELLVDHNQHEEGITFGRYRFPGRGTGNVVLEGHNIMYGNNQLFSLLYLADMGDGVVIHFKRKRYVYEIKQRHIIKPRDIRRFARQTKDDRLTLITCYPPASTSMRLVLIAKPKEGLKQ